MVRLSWVVFLVALMALLIGAQSAAIGQEQASTPAPGPVRVLLVTATASFYHPAIPVAQDSLQRLAQESGAFTITLVPDVASLASLNAESLSRHHVVFFMDTSGELPLNAGQKQALLDFVASGGGFVGTHSATDTLYTWPEYGQLIGAFFLEHPWTQEVSVKVEDQAHPLTVGLGSEFRIYEEIYTFRTNPRSRARVLLRLDPSSVGVDPAADYPLAWCSTHGAGRVYYNALGHFESIWTDPRFQQQLLSALLWAGGRVPASCEVTP